jgi:predicted enzyme related to lactoylglutathione lyase
MKKSILGLRTVGYNVSDIQAAKVWYAKAFETEPYFDEPYYVGFDIGGFELGLQPEDTSSNKVESVVAYWGVENVQEQYDRILAIGATAIEAPTEVGGGIIIAKLKDPWDNIIGLIYNPHFDLSKLTQL